MSQAPVEPRRPLVAGLTGGVADGKTTVSQYMAGKGAYLIDADSVGHRVIAPGGEAFAEVVAAFGEEILAADGVIDRRRLGAMVFSDPERLKTLNAISHPHMAEAMAREIAEVKERPDAILPPLIVLDAAILFEAGWQVLCDEVWVVTADPEMALQRLMTRDRLGRDEALARLRAQMSDEERIAKADRSIRNDGKESDLIAQVQRIWEEATAEPKAS